jgi:hypothetical protein
MNDSMTHYYRAAVAIIAVSAVWVGIFFFLHWLAVIWGISGPINYGRGLFMDKLAVTPAEIIITGGLAILAGMAVVSIWKLWWFKHV